MVLVIWFDLSLPPFGLIAILFLLLVVLDDVFYTVFCF